MGGNLYSKRRINKSEYDDIQKEVFSLLNRPSMYVPKTFKEKETFGDLDICLPLPLVTEEQIRDIFKTDKLTLNTSVWSFGYKDFQIDLCHFPFEDLRSAVDYMSFGDLSNMIGVLANYAMGLRFTHRGLVAPIKLKQEQPLGEIVIHNDIVGVLDFMDLNEVEWLFGFNNEEEAFRWITKSQYFNPDFFKFENLNHQNRTRNRKRAMYSRFVEWCEVHDTLHRHTPTLNKSEHLWRAVLDFGMDWMFQAEPIITNFRRVQWAAKTFSGDDVKRITGLEGKELGKVLNDYKASVGNWLDHVCSRGQEGMDEHFTKWYKTYEKQSKKA